MPKPRLALEAPKAAKRPTLAPPPAPAINIAESNETFLPSGSVLLDLVLGGGWCLGRCVNLVGDRSSGKTLLAVEACANFARLYEPGSIRYVEAEAAFDEQYAEMIGMPRGVQMEDGVQTVEQLHDDISEFLEKRKKGDGPCMYVLDSLDALSDAAEMERDIEKGSYGGGKAKKMSEFFRKRIKLIEDRKCLFIVISQIRDKLNVTFGETKTRSGGRALDFYASQIVWLAEVGKIHKQVLGEKRTVGLEVKARTKKNKVGIPFRDCELSIVFSYGVDDEVSMFNWLKSQKCIDQLALEEKQILPAIVQARKDGDRDVLNDIHADMKVAVQRRWRRIEEALAPTMKKYG